MKTAGTGLVFISVSAIIQDIAAARGLRVMRRAPHEHFLVSLIVIAFAVAPAWPQLPMQESTDSTFENLANSATAAREAGKSEEAIRAYQRALAFRADWEEGWWYLGTLQYDADRFAEAIPALQRVVQLDPALGPAWNFLGLCEFETHDYENSLEHLQKGLDLGTGDDPESSRISKYHLALLLNRDGEFEKAFATLGSAFADQAPAQIKIALGLSLLRIPLLPQEVDPSQDALVQAAGETAAIRAQGNPANGFDSFRDLLKKYPNTPYLHYAFGIALASAARNEEAILEQREEVKISPASAPPYVEISVLELRLHHQQDALRAAETAVRLAPDSAAAHRALAQSLEILGEKEKSVKELREADVVATEKPVRESRIVQMYAHATAAASPQAAPAKAPTATDLPANLDELSRQAAASLAAGNSDEAIGIYQQALQLHPEWDEGWWNLAMLSYSTGHYPEAIAALKACVARKPNNGTAWAVMGLSEFEMKDYSNALIHLQRGQDLGLGGSPESVQLATCRLAILLNRNKEFDRAVQLLGPEAGSGPHAEEIQFVLGMALLRIALLPDQVKAAKNNLVRTAGDIAALLLSSKYDAAFPKLQSLLRQYPATPFLHYAYGTALASLSQYDDAESQFRQELLISPASELPYSGLASIALKTRRPADAFSSAQRAVQLAPDSAEAHYLLGRSFLELGQEEKAIQELETARKIAPASPEVHFSLAKAYARAHLPEKAEQERATFARLNALAEMQRSRHGNQSYSGSHDKSEFSISPAQSNDTAAEPH
jgi:tetratricopeptide (TPR) repeat protein